MPNDVIANKCWSENSVLVLVKALA